MYAYVYAAQATSVYITVPSHIQGLRTPFGIMLCLLSKRCVGVVVQHAMYTAIAACSRPLILLCAAQPESKLIFR